MKSVYLVIAVTAVLLFGCAGSTEVKGTPYKNVTLAEDAIPKECAGLEDCALFSCMIASCWCDEYDGSSGVLVQGGEKIGSEEEAQARAEDYLKTNSIDYEEESVRASQLNDVFYNVFYEDGYGDEKVVTVAVDGTIMKTECGV
ncbi:MAG: hypothetical protein ABIH99_00625 [Candidatus Micrarchaeota archaeon]